MKLYVCWGTWTAAPRPGGHPCGVAYEALREAGHEPEVVKAYGLGMLPDAVNRTAGRRRAKELTGSSVVPVLELDDGTAIADSKAIVAWARANTAASVV
jgi:Glutathione S-transferase, N-terminal domain